MTYSVLLLEEAENDVEQAASWYEQQSSGLGYAFLEIVSSTIEAVGRNPLAYPLVYRDVHRALMRKFPFAIFFRINDKNVAVVSVMHVSRDLAKWQQRV